MLVRKKPPSKLAVIKCACPFTEMEVFCLDGVDHFHGQSPFTVFGNIFKVGSAEIKGASAWQRQDGCDHRMQHRT